MAKQVRWNDKNIKLLVEHAETAKTRHEGFREVADIFGCSFKAVELAYARHAHKILNPKNGEVYHKWSDKEKTLLVTMKKGGYKYDAISEHLLKECGSARTIGACNVMFLKLMENERDIVSKNLIPVENSEDTKSRLRARITELEKQLKRKIKPVQSTVIEKDGKTITINVNITV